MQAHIGTLFCEVMYVPFKDATKGPLSSDPVDAKRDGTQDSQPTAQQLAVAHTFSHVTDDDKGILTISLQGCSNLQVGYSC